MREALARSDRDFLSEEAEFESSRLLSTLMLVLRRPIEIAGSLTMAGFTAAIIVNALGMQVGPHPAPFFAREWPLRAADSALPPAPTPPARPVAQAAPPAAADASTADAPTADVPAAPSDGSALLRDIQTELAARNYYDGTPDGVLGRKSDAAIRAFQTRMGLTVDGQPSEDLLSRLKAAPVPQAAAREGGDPIAALIAASAPSAAPPVRPATTPVPPSKRLLAIEKTLAALGYGPLKVDGIMDGDTRAAISRFERDRSLPVTGQVSPRLVKELTAVSGIALE
ncbi:peptidoglycan-binding domain-containing protein [Labrys wisconsinensis]|uniref:Peptidoglycan hydrolase-like protein with peptidoglycan-binding domain n=1 Tax=Labrys wisconsinensis TaxID=425677 RepID=A0ABU0J977_9HYPH|nr:peptidoglycan-binding protein [Labrys wisconsinensis]MDQ0469712.1 peptidoglycan hydrolase-like protein with peptidoglycan-binding domain [Labrys wisconsinensis]